MLFLLIVALLPFKFHFLRPFSTLDAAILVFAAHTLFTKKIEWKRFFWGEETRFLTLFLAWLLFSAGTISYQTVEPLVAFGLFYFIASSAVSQETIKKSLWVLLAVSLFEGAVACGQFFTQHPLGLKMLGEVKFTSRHHSPARFYAEGTTPIIRAYGTFAHPNILGGFFAFCLLASYPLFLQAKKKWLIASALSFQLLTLFLTFSRSAFLGLILGSSLFFFLLRKEKGIKPLIWTLAGSFALCLLLFYPKLQARGGFISYNAASQASDMGRLTYQENALSLIRDHPLLGVGMGRYLDYFRDYVHNIYLLIGAETGLIGLGLFLALFFAVIKKSWPFRTNTLVAAFLSILVALGVIGMCDFYLWIHVSGRVMLIIGIGVMAVVSRSRVAIHVQ